MIRGRASRVGLGFYAAVLAVLSVGPLGVVVIGAFTAGGYVTIPPHGWSFRWFTTAAHSDLFISSFKFSLFTASVAAVVCALIGGLAAYSLYRFNFRGERAVQGIALLPIFIPHLILALGLLEATTKLGLPRSPEGLIGGDIVITLPFVFRFARVRLAALDPDVVRASYVLGASELATVRRVVFPLVLPGLLTGAVLAFLIAFDESVISIFLSAPGKTTLPAQIYNYLEQQTDPVVAAVSTWIIALSVGTVLIVDRVSGFLGVLVGEVPST